MLALNQIQVIIYLENNSQKLVTNFKGFKLSIKFEKNRPVLRFVSHFGGLLREALGK